MNVIGYKIAQDIIRYFKWKNSFFATDIFLGQFLFFNFNSIVNVL